MTAAMPAAREGSARAAALWSGRLLLAILTVYALAMIAPEILRLAQPLGSFGLATNADGLIYDVRGPFESEEESPAFQAGLRVGEHLDLQGMRCVPLDTEVCASSLALWGGVNYVMTGRPATLHVAGNEGKAPRDVIVIAKERPANLPLRVVLVVDEIAGILVVLGAAYLVWTRPGPMTWGFFLYMMYFNPGQVFQFFAWAQQWPRLLFAQDVISCVLQAAAYTGLLLFALRAPVDRTEPRWRPVERLLPLVGGFLLVVSLASLGSAFGFKTEHAMRSSLLLGFAVSLGALAILVDRRKDLSPQDYQRIRWVIWGCLIGLPAYLLAELSMETSLPTTLFGGVPEDLASLLYLVNGVFCLFVVEAIRRPTVVNVAIPLRRITVLSLIFSLPVFLLHEKVAELEEILHLPPWGWLLVATGLVFLLSRLHEFAAELVESFFDRAHIKAEQELTERGEALEQAKSLAEIERLLVEAPVEALKLASAAVFREQGGGFRRRASHGWQATDADVLTGVEPMFARLSHSAPFPIEQDADTLSPPLPHGVARPLIGFPVGNARHCFALALFSGHDDGTDLEAKKKALLQEFVRKGANAYAQVDADMLRTKVALLESQLARAGAAG